MLNPGNGNMDDYCTLIAYLKVFIMKRKSTLKLTRTYEEMDIYDRGGT